MPWLIITLFTSSQEAKAAGRRTGGAGEGKPKERGLAMVTLLSCSLLLHLCGMLQDAGCCGMLWDPAVLGCWGMLGSAVSPALGRFPRHFTSLFLPRPTSSPSASETRLSSSCYFPAPKQMRVCHAGLPLQPQPRFWEAGEVTGVPLKPGEADLPLRGEEEGNERMMPSITRAPY